MTRWRALRTDVGSAAALGFVGDIICQLGPEGRRLLPPLPRRSDEAPAPPSDAASSSAPAKAGVADQYFDMRRLAALTFFNAAYIGGFLHFLYSCYPLVLRSAARSAPAGLSKRLGDEASVAHAVGCGLVDNVHNGAVYIPAFFLGVGLLQGDTWEGVQASLRREWLETYAWCTAFWLPFSSINFGLVPPSGRVRAMAAANLVWNVVIDWLAHRGPPVQE